MINKNIFILGCLSMLVAGCSKQETVDDQISMIRYVRTIEVSNSTGILSRELPGVVEANKEANLSFRISGKVEELLVKEGDIVQQGQLLAALDDDDILIKLKSDQAAYDSAIADFNRGKALVGSGTISQAEYNQLESSLAAAESTLEITKQNLLYATLEAPFSGVIAKRSIENFEEVQAKQTVLTLQDVSTIDIRVDVPESIMILTTEETRPYVEAIFDAIPGRTFPLSFKEVALQADSETNTYEVTMSMPRVEGFNILPGMSVTARAKQQTSINDSNPESIYVPAHAVLQDSSGRFAFVAVEKGDGLATVERREVVTGALNSLGLEVLSGVDSGEKLIVAGMSKMFDGLEVKIAQD